MIEGVDDRVEIGLEPGAELLQERVILRAEAGVVRELGEQGEVSHVSEHRLVGQSVKHRARIQSKHRARFGPEAVARSVRKRCRMSDVLAVPRRPLVPREHGAYGQLFFPLAAVLLVGLPRPAAVCLAASAVIAFFAHEPLVVALGRRGTRLRRERGREALRTFAALAVTAFLTFAFFVTEVSSDALVLFAVPAAFLVGLSVFVVFDAEKTTPGELLAACTLSTLALPLAVANNLPVAYGVGVAGTYAIGFSVATVAVRAMARAKIEGVSATAWAARLFGPVLLAVGLAVCPSKLGAIAMVVMVAPSLVVAWTLPSPKHLRRVGWTLVGASALATVLLVVEGSSLTH